MKMNLHCFANLISIMILELFSNSGLINATEFGKRTDALEASAWNESKWISAVDAPVVKGHNNGRAADELFSITVLESPEESPPAL